MDLCWAATFDLARESLLVRDGRLGESYPLLAASKCGRGHYNFFFFLFNIHMTPHSPYIMSGDSDYPVPQRGQGGLFKGTAIPTRWIVHHG